MKIEVANWFLICVAISFLIWALGHLVFMLVHVWAEMKRQELNEYLAGKRDLRDFGQSVK